MQLHLVTLLSTVSVVLAGGRFKESCKDIRYRNDVEALSANCGTGSGGYHYTEVALNWILTNRNGVLSVSTYGLFPHSQILPYTISNQLIPRTFKLISSLVVGAKVRVLIHLVTCISILIIVVVTPCTLAIWSITSMGILWLRFGVQVVAAGQEDMSTDVT